MTVYVDEPTRYPSKFFGETNERIGRGQWAHCWADSEDELDRFAKNAGIPILWITKRHGKAGFTFCYVSPTMQKSCLEMGAQFKTVVKKKDLFNEEKS